MSKRELLTGIWLMSMALLSLFTFTVFFVAQMSPDILDIVCPILAAVRTSIETPFLRKVLAVENVLVVQMQPERFTEIYAQLSPIVAAWEQEAALC